MVWAEGRGQIRGVIQRDGQGFAEQRIMLIRFGPDQEVQRTPGQTDAHGRFLFDQLETGATFTYFVGIRYQEQLHRSEPIVLQSAEPVEVVLELGAPPAPAGEAQGEPPQPRIVNHLMVIVGRQSHLEVREVVRIVNPGTTSYIVKSPGPGIAGVSLRLSLPPGYSNLSQVQGLAAAHVRVDATGLVYVAPLPPGEHRVMYSYHLPWHGTLTTILLERTLDTAALDVLVEDTRLVSTSDLQFGGRVAIDPHAFFHFRGMNLAASSRSWVQLIPQGASVSWLSIGAYALIIAIALVGVALPLRHSWRGRRQEEAGGSDMPPPEHLRELRVVGQNVLRSMAHLDDQHEAGGLAEAVYRQRRQAYKQQLFQLVEQLQSVPVRPAAVSEPRGGA